MLWVPKMPSESFRPEFHQINEFNFDSAFVNADKFANFGINSWPSRATSFRFPAPIKPKPLTTPFDDSLRFDDQQSGAPIAPESR
jgi:hypothetical protein